MIRPTHSRSRRVHVEAFPRLNVREVRRSVLAGHQHVLCRGEDGVVWGKAQISIDTGQLRVDTSFHAVDGQPARDQVSLIALETVRRPEGAKDCFAFCPKCHGAKRFIACLGDDWICRLCQQLTHRSTMIGDVARMSEHLRKLDAEVAEGRPKGMHEATFQQKRLKRAELKALLGDELATASTAYANVVTAYWLNDLPLLVEDGGGAVGDGPA